MTKPLLHVKYLIPKILLPLILLGCTADLRNHHFDKVNESERKIKGKKLLTRAALVHQDSSITSKTKSSVVILEDHWKGLTKLFCPWPESRTQLKLKFTPNKKEGQVTFLTTKEKGTTWGVKKGKTYQLKEGKPVYTPNKNMALFVPGLQYLLNLPVRASREASQVIYIGEEKLGDKNFDLVLATWGKGFSLDKKYDQFVFWINKKSGLVEKAGFTTREFSRLYKACLHFEDFKSVHGALKPHLLRVNSHCKKDPEKNDRVISVSKWTMGGL